MCLTILAAGIDMEWPVRILSFREEFLERAFDPPAAWWPEHADVVGGRDAQAGGTWFAVSAAAGRVVAIHTSFTPRVDASLRRTRGELAVAAAASDAWRERDFAPYDDFTMLTVAPGDVSWHTYRGESLVTEQLTGGVHLGSVAGLGPDVPRPRQKYWTDVVNDKGMPAVDATGSPAEDWHAWLERTGADALELTHEMALLMRRTGKGRLFGTSSVSSVAISSAGGISFFTLTDPLSGGWVQAPPVPATSTRAAGR